VETIGADPLHPRTAGDRQPAPDDEILTLVWKVTDMTKTLIEAAQTALNLMMSGNKIYQSDCNQLREAIEAASPLPQGDTLVAETPKLLRDWTPPFQVTSDGIKKEAGYERA
jgi:hypothetical protein